MEEEEMAELPAGQYLQAKKVQQLHGKTTEAKFEGPRYAIWLYGDSGAGKSRYVKSFNYFMKAVNSKWWDGYKQQKHVLLDEVGTKSFKSPYHDLAYSLKIWADPYGKLRDEIKNCTIALNYQFLWITSNYSPEVLLGDNKQLLLSIQRRFSVFECFVTPDSSKPDARDFRLKYRFCPPPSCFRDQIEKGLILKNLPMPDCRYDGDNCAAISVPMTEKEMEEHLQNKKEEE